jgi:hypothetical protein
LIKWMPHFRILLLFSCVDNTMSMEIESRLVFRGFLTAARRYYKIRIFGIKKTIIHSRPRCAGFVPKVKSTLSSLLRGAESR